MFRIKLPFQIFGRMLLQNLSLSIAATNPKISKNGSFSTGSANFTSKLFAHASGDKLTGNATLWSEQKNTKMLANNVVVIKYLMSSLAIVKTFLKLKQVYKRTIYKLIARLPLLIRKKGKDKFKNLHLYYITINIKCK